MSPVCTGVVAAQKIRVSDSIDDYTHIDRALSASTVPTDGSPVAVAQAGDAKPAHLYYFCHPWPSWPYPTLPARPLYSLVG